MRGRGTGAKAQWAVLQVHAAGTFCVPKDEPYPAASPSKRSANAPLSFASRPNSTKSFPATLPRSKPRNLLTLYPALLDLRTSSAKKARTRGAGQSRRATLEMGLVALTRCLMMIENSKPQHCAMLCMQPPAVCRRPAPPLLARASASWRPL